MVKVQKMYPADVRGPWRSRRNLVSLVLMGVFLLLPWVRIQGNPAILLDLATRRFSIFGVLFWAHDAPMLFLVFASAGLALFFVTSVFGRAWCGWACPETVFVEQVFRRIERWIEGDAVTRRRLDDGPVALDWLSKKLVKWGLFSLVSLVIGHSFVAYFVGTEKLGKMMQESPAAHPGTFGAMLAASGLVLFAFGWFREQFCIILCPYGRFQSVLMDPRSLLVAYDRKRGEPRRGKAGAAREAGAAAGDCVDCGKCVQVCPTGIDIRQGTQMECIACTSCVDACDSVMERLKKPKGLIHYATESGLPLKVFRARPLVYAGLFSAVFGTLAWLVARREPLNIDFLRQGGLPYVEVSVPGLPSGALWSNRATLHLHSESFDDQAVEIRLPKEEISRGVQLRVSGHAGILPAGGRERAGVELLFPKTVTPQGHGKTRLEIEVRPKKGGELELRRARTLIQEVPLVGPFH
jgi:cytochrome c oxidase accessory protein FixG